MNVQYKAILVNKNLYKEVLLPADASNVIVGTASEVDVRLPKNSFFEQFQLCFTNEGTCWTVSCTPNIYLTTGGVSKLPQKQLNHGDELIVKYYASDVEMLSVSVMIDFDQVDQDFFRVIDIKGRDQITIGGNERCDIQIKNNNIANDLIILTQRGGYWQLEEKVSRYGVYVNGARIHEAVRLRNYDFFALDEYKFFIKGSRLYTTRDGVLKVNALQQYLDAPSKSSLTYPKFNRSTRLKAKPISDEITVLDPPEMPQEPQESLAATLFPAIAMLVVTVVIRGMMSSTNSSFVILSAGDKRVLFS